MQSLPAFHVRERKSRSKGTVLFTVIPDEMTANIPLHNM